MPLPSREWVQPHRPNIEQSVCLPDWGYPVRSVHPTPRRQEGNDMPKPVSEQVVVIAGASTGIGRATALAFAASGAKVVCAARSTHALDTLVEQIRADGGTAIAAPTDVADPAAVRALAEVAEQQYDRIDTWVNNAAVSVWGRVEDITDEEFDRVMRVNFLGQVHGVHAALPALRRAGGGVIIGVASVEGVRAIPLHGPYTASKFALRALYDCLRMELAQEGAPIAVTTILPASIDTPFFEHARSKLGAMVKPPPPVYAPEIVADTIVYAAAHPRREIPVGGAAVGFFLGQRLSPALTDTLLSIRRLGVGTQRTGRPDNGVDNVDAPMDGPGQVHGSHPGRVLRHSMFTRLIGRRTRPGELATAAVSRLRRVSRPGQRTPARQAVSPPAPQKPTG
jgi:NAD(P)-dependent dehydrogenase (short-subunit alcohol dehydrogenase family)